MEEVIVNIIKEIKPGLFFDAHMIISKIIEEYSDIYLSTFTSGSTHAYHGRIAQMISRYEGSYVEKQENDILSKNIHGKYSNCSLWKRI